MEGKVVDEARNRLLAAEQATDQTAAPAGQHHRRVAIWLRVRLPTKRMTTVAADCGYRDRSGVDRVIKRLEEKAKSDRAPPRRLKALAKEASRVKS